MSALRSVRTALGWALLLVGGGMLAVMICTTVALVAWFSIDVAAGLRRVLHRARCRRAWRVVVADALAERADGCGVPE